MNGFLVVLAKECRDNIRDRRTLVSSLSLAVLGPALFAALMGLVLDTTLGEAREPFTLAVSGAVHAPGLMQHLERQNVTLERIEVDDPQGAVAAGAHSLLLVIDADYPERFAAGEINALALYYDSSGMGTTRRNAMLTRQYVSAYSQKLGVLRLQLRGVDPKILTPVVVQEFDTASPAARALTLLATLPYLLVLVIFMGGFYLAIDATAGEREHGSLEPLLSQPVSRVGLVLGKIGAASAFSALSLALFLTSLALSLPLVPLHKVGMSLELGLVDAAVMFALCLPLVVFAAAMLTVVASFARTYKEAQTYLTVVILIPTLPLIVTQVMNLRTEGLLMLVPSLSQASLVAAAIRGEALAWGDVALATLGTLLGAAALTALAVAMYRRERILV
ncbi:MAG: ABC transporter permease [Pseudomonadales bacterium]|nr:ABC transporter permease [Pseudomonadales bacterium]